jgi:hypothetical protein
MLQTAECGRGPSPQVSGSRFARLFFGVGILVLALVVPLCASDNKKPIPTKPSNEECLAAITIPA